MTQNENIILQLLQTNCFITLEEKNTVIKALTGNPELTLETALLEYFLITPEEYTMMVSSCYGMGIINFDDITISQTCIDAIPKEICEKYILIATEFTPRQKDEMPILTIAICDPTNTEQLGVLDYALGDKYIMEFEIACSSHIKAALNVCYGCTFETDYVKANNESIKELGTGKKKSATVKIKVEPKQDSYKMVPKYNEEEKEKMALDYIINQMAGLIHLLKKHPEHCKRYITLAKEMEKLMDIQEVEEVPKKSKIGTSSTKTSKSNKKYTFNVEQEPYGQCESLPATREQITKDVIKAHKKVKK